MRILLTGAAGFIGSTVLDQLREAGHEVLAVDSLIEAAHQGRPSWAATDLIEADVCDQARMTELLDGVDAVCHQAAMVGVGKDALDTPTYVRHNLLGTATLLAAMAKADVGTLVQASSMVVYGDGAYRCPEDGMVRPRARSTADIDAGRFDPTCPHCRRPLTWEVVEEDARLDPRTTYAVTKLGQEQLAAAWTAQTGGQVISLRYHNVYGPRMPRDTPYAGVASMFRSSLAAGRPPRVFEDGRQMRDFVEVSDVARANVAALERLVGAGDRGGNPDGEAHRAYNVASGDPRPILDLASTLAQVLDGPPPEIVGGGRPGDVRHVVADPSRAARELGFRAQVGFRDGVARFADAPMREAVGGA